MSAAVGADDGGRPVQLGLFLSGQHPPSVAARAALRDHLEQVALARELGFDSIWAGQHFLSEPFQMFQTIPLLARVAAEAEGMTLGTGILLLPLLNPLEVAENAATLNEIADGKFILGLGVGYRAVENAAFGVRGDRFALFERKLEIVRGLLAGDAVSAAGDGSELDQARLTLRPSSPPPIWIAANADGAVRRAARLADAWMINPHTRLEQLQPQVELFEAERHACGKPPSEAVPIIKEVCVAESDAAAMDTARPFLAAKYEAYVRWGQDEVLPEGDTLQREWEQLTGGGRFILGSPQTCATQIREHVDRLGVNQLIVRAQWPGMPQADVLRTLRLLATEVLPAV
jgi:alkanesulfonate monooxygenase SsuD/methylene tetrahydromethanopterin reductase-like flavin-dependent oxidoreductase (luciferase family)